MYELAIPGSLTVLPTPEPAARRTMRRARNGLRYGLLLWVLAGHAAALWLVQVAAGRTPQATAPKVLRVSWVAAEPRPAPPAAQPVRISPPPPRPKPHPIRHLPAPVAVRPAEPETPPAPPQQAEPQPAPQPPAPPTLPSPANPKPPHPAPPVVMPPSYHADYLANPAPVYPDFSRRLGEEGTVRLKVHVAPDGRPLEIVLAQSSGHPRLDRAAEDAVAGWRFVPARLGDTPVAGWVLVPISFTLRR